MAVYGYIRVSTEGKGQTTDNQRKVIEDAGYRVDQFFSEDGVSGSTKAFARPAFSAMMAKAQPNDIVIVTMLDRLGRSTIDVLGVVEEFAKRQIKLILLQFGAMDITTSAGKLMLSVMAACAELERNILIERTVAGLERTKAQGTKLGRPLTIPPEVLFDLSVAKENKVSLDTMVAAYGAKYPRNTIHRTLKAWEGNIDGYRAEWDARQQQYAKNS